ncbi:Molybdopterin molybdenumtransferase [hydrothermal vent metagenome]|uniref:Molybdopterin molybdenumtransferase n=1 Tax=hydrothermal vent metagenome TaxID=652676 RepID=A0A3B0UDK5_9ZZZZ
MISLEQALNIASEYAKPIGIEAVYFSNSLGRVLAEDVYSDVDMPPFNKSAMDGYACRREDLNNELKVLEVIPAGSPPTLPVTKNSCSKIMTGAEVPRGADTVIMVEHTEETGPGTIRFTGTKTSSNICLVGEDLQKGSQVLTKGTLIEPQHIAMLAAVGCFKPMAYKQPTVGIISTGSELIEPDKKPTPSKIRNSNGHQLVAQVSKIGLPVNYLGIVEDDAEATLEAIRKSTSENEVTLISGGVSIGDFDYVPRAIEQAGFKILFNKMSVKPGKHTTLAVSKGTGATTGNKKYIIGLPGNPVSSFIQFEIFAKPFLNKLRGLDKDGITCPLEMAHDFERRKTDRDEFLPVTLNKENRVELVQYNGSAHIHAYHNAFGFISIEKNKKGITKGEAVYVRPI